MLLSFRGQRCVKFQFFHLFIFVAGEDWRRAAADDQSSERGASAGRGSSGPAEEAATESDAEGECGAKGTSSSSVTRCHDIVVVMKEQFIIYL